MADACTFSSSGLSNPGGVVLADIHLLTFADESHEASSRRVIKQARGFPFKTVRAKSEKNLSADFRELLADYLTAGSKGYGFMLWKPEVILNTMEALPEGDTLLYVDAGCHLQRSGLGRFHDYLLLLEMSSYGILGFQHRPNLSNRFDTKETPDDITDAPYTKTEVLQELGSEVISHQTDTPGLQSGVIFFKNTEPQRNFVRRWRNIGTEFPFLFSDKFDPLIQLPGFIAPRHDQTVFSLLAKKWGADTLSAWETWLPGMSRRRYQSFASSPIVARRDLRAAHQSRFSFK